jgi:hypothetical protein
MKNEFIPYEQALELKELGFDEPCIAFYEPGNKQVQVVGVEQRYNNPELLRMEDFCAPLYQQAFRWFRERCGLEVILCPDALNNPEKKLREYKIISYDKSMVLEPIAEPHWWTREGCFKTYEEAELACLKKLIEIVNTKEK